MLIVPVSKYFRAAAEAAEAAEAEEKGVGLGHVVGLAAEVDSLLYSGLAAFAGLASHGRQSHSDTTLYISLVILHTKYAGARQHDFNVYA
jgi:hypothetical protein